MRSKPTNTLNNKILSCDDDHLIFPKNIVIKACSVENLVNLSSFLLKNPRNIDQTRYYLTNLCVMSIIPQDVREYIKVYCDKCSMLKIN